MDKFLISGSEMQALIILPILIFFFRVLDVSLGTIRIIFISKGYKYLAPIIGFLEISIWLIAITQIFQNLTNITYYIAYSGGFSAGTFAGILMEDKLSIGVQLIRIITSKDASELIETLKSRGYSITSSYANDRDDLMVNVVYVVIDRHDIPEVTELIKKYNPKAFFSIEDIKFVSELIPSHSIPWHKKHPNGLFKHSRKGK